MDRFEECIYRAGEVARCPARVPVEPLTPEQFDQLLEEGDQRVGGTLFRTECPFCRACEPVRIDIAAFQPNKSQRRILARNDRQIRMEFGAPVLSRRRVALWNQHRDRRDLMTEHSRRDPTGYHEWLVDSCVPTTEVSYYLDQRLIAVSLLDTGRSSVNSAYHYFDPHFSHLSLGVYSVLKEMEWARARGCRWYYLGLWVRDCDALRYKTGYAPHERFVSGVWTRFEEAEPPMARSLILPEPKQPPRTPRTGPTEGPREGLPVARERR